MFVTTISNISTFHGPMSPSLDASDPITNPVNTLRYRVSNSNNTMSIGMNIATTNYPHDYDDPGANSFDDHLLRFHEFFLDFYGYASVVVCVFGVITNIINISVLMAKEMRTPTNNFLIALAVFDILTMLPFMPLVIHFNCPPVYPMSNPGAYSFSWVLFYMTVTHLTATTHTISLWLAVSLAAFRYNQISAPCPRGPLARERRIRKVRIIIAIVMIVSIIVLIPSYVTQNIERVNYPNISFYAMQDKMKTEDGKLIYLTNILIYGILGKIVPCILILIFSGYLICRMSAKNIRRRQRLSTMAQQWKTTNMLLVVLILFICTELPQGILIVLTATVHNFFDDIHYYLGDLFDFVSLLNNAINFILYCAMSQQFREQFVIMYVNRCCRRNANDQVRAYHSEVLTMRDGVPRTTTTTTTTHIHEDPKTAKL